MALIQDPEAFLSQPKAKAGKNGPKRRGFHSPRKWPRAKNMAVRITPRPKNTPYNRKVGLNFCSKRGCR